MYTWNEMQPRQIEANVSDMRLGVSQWEDFLRRRRLPLPREAILPMS